MIWMTCKRIGVYSSILRHLRKTFRTLRIKSARQVDSRQHQQQQHPQQISDAAPGGTLHSPVHSGVSIRNEPLPPPPPLQIEATVVPQQLAKSPTQCTTGFTGSGPSLVSGDILNSVNCVESSTATSPKAREVVIQAPTTPISGMGTGSSFRGTMSLSGILRTTFSNPFSRTSTGVSSARSTGDSRVLNELAGKTRPPAHIAVLSINPVHLFLPEDAMRSPDGAGRGSSRSKQPRNKRPSQDDRGVTTEMDAANEQTILSIDVPALQAASFFEKSAAVPHASRDNDASPISLSSTGKRHPSHTGSLAAGKFKNPLRLVRQSVSLDGHHSGTPQAPASRTSSGRSLRLLKIEAQLLRRGFLIFCSFGVTWALFMTIVMSMYVTKQRCPPALDMATSIMLLLSPIIEPLIIIRTDRQWAKAMRELQCELLGMLGVPAWVFSSAAQSDSDGVVHGWH
ncbi:hypothetical protein BC828DRAFT_377319 [Blastocladiella britannica]|nr:hypothetical protein BC828DRAFT_377319 [Blastocladiella britannica]